MKGFIQTLCFFAACAVVLGAIALLRGRRPQDAPGHVSPPSRTGAKAPSDGKGGYVRIGVPVYLGVKGKRLGPFTPETVKEKIRAGEVVINRDIIWQEGMADWVRLSEVLDPATGEFRWQRGEELKAVAARRDREAEAAAAKLSADELSKRWREEGLKYVAAANQFIERAKTVGWDKAGKEPEDTRTALARRVIDEVRAANEKGQIAGLRDRFPPAYAPFMHLLDENGQHLAPVALLPDGRILLGIGFQTERVVLVDGTNVQDVPGVLAFGRSPDRKYFAVARKESIDIHEGWDGPKVMTLEWPKVGPLQGVQQVDQVIPFPDGRRVILATRAAILAVEPGRAVLLYPRSIPDLEKMWADFKGRPYLNNPHAAISPDGSMISAGDRLACEHFIFNARYELVGKIYPLVDCAPCHTSFSPDGQWVTLSSYTLYEGATMAVPTARFPGLNTTFEQLQASGWFDVGGLAASRAALTKLDRDLVLIDQGARVYSAVWRKGEFILGDASGSLRACDKGGRPLWEHHIGSSVGDIDLSPDGKQLAVTTYAGFLCLLDLDTGERDPFVIGNSTHRERRRWVFWKTEPKPLVW